MKPLLWNLLGKMSHITNSHSELGSGLSNSLLRTTRHVELETKCTSKVKRVPHDDKFLRERTLLFNAASKKIMHEAQWSDFSSQHSTM